MHHLRVVAPVTRQHFIFFGCLLVAIILHEVSHGVVALAYGDDTAKRAGRLTLNPLPHIDPLGSLIIPVMAVLANLPVLGWAKPVPVNPSRLRNPRSHMLLVGLAGPATNFSLMIVAAVAAKAFLDGAPPRFCGGLGGVSLAGDIMASFAVVNLLLGLFNLLPIPPLDGSSLIERVLPPRALPGWYKFRPYGILVLLVGLYYLHIFEYIFGPFYRLLCGYLV